MPVKQKAFTLLETLIALAISVIVMGAVLAANRTVQQGAVISEQRAQMDSILAESFDLLTMTHNTTRAYSQPFSTPFAGLSSTVNSPMRIVPYRHRQVTPFTPSSPIVVLWCTVGAPPGCGSLSSPVSPTNANFPMTGALADSEIIAVRKGDPVTGEAQLYDFMYLPTSGSIANSFLALDNATHQKEWNFYRRTIDITNRSSIYTGFSVTVTVWPVIAGSARPGEAVTRTMVYTDYAP